MNENQFAKCISFDVTLKAGNKPKLPFKKIAKQLRKGFQKGWQFRNPEFSNPRCRKRTDKTDSQIQTVTISFLRTRECIQRPQADN